MTTRRYTPKQPEQTGFEKALMIAIGSVIAVVMGIARCDSGGHYAGGEGSSHKGGHYENPSTDNHYKKH